MRNVMNYLRKCDGCTACCEGWLHGQAEGQYFQAGRPCHFKCEKGCSIYENRPENPCRTYECEWKTNLEIPEWMKPNLSEVIITRRNWKNGEYLEINEMGNTIKSVVLNWLFIHHCTTGVPIRVQVSGGWNNFGPKEFLNEMNGIRVLTDH